MTLGEVDGQAGAQRLLDARTWPTGMCLNAVWETSGAGTSDAPGAYQSAKDWWDRCPADRKHIGDRNPPAGALLRFSNGNADGHICYSLGGEAAASTDKPSSGRTGQTTISDIERSWGGRRYEGWTDWLGGWTVTNAASPRPNTTEVAQEEDEMKYMQGKYADDDGTEKYIAFVPGTAWYLDFQDLNGDPIASGFAQQQDVPRDSTPITKSMRDAIVAAADRVAAASKAAT